MTVTIPRSLGLAVGDRRRVDVEAGTVREAVAGLEHALPGARGHLLDEAGALRQHVLCFVDGEATRDLDHAVTRDVRFLTAVSGG